MKRVTVTVENPTTFYELIDSKVCIFKPLQQIRDLINMIKLFDKERLKGFKSVQASQLPQLLWSLP
jgi:hypothetical protein